MFGTPQPKQNPHKNLMSAGNLGMQKFEARKYMERFYRALTAPTPTKETTDWKSADRQKYLQLARATTKRVREGRERKAKVWEQENRELAHMIYHLKTEDRQTTTKSSGPGWRKGSLGGAVIDCYPTDNPLAYKYAELHGYEHRMKRRQKEIKRDNAKLKEGIGKLTSDLSAAAMKKSYDENRYRARFFFNKGQETELHLGLLDEFKGGGGEDKKKQKQKRPLSAHAVNMKELAVKKPVFLQNKKWNDDSALPGSPSSREVHTFTNPAPWSFDQPSPDTARYKPLYARALSLEKAAVAYSPLHAARGPLEFYSELRRMRMGLGLSPDALEKLNGGERERPASAGDYFGRAASQLNQGRRAMQQEQQQRPSSADPTYRPQVLKQKQPMPAREAERDKWIDQLPPYARRGRGSSPSGGSRSRSPSPSSAAAYKKEKSAPAAPAQAQAQAPAQAPLASEPLKRKICLLRQPMTVASALGAAITMRLSVSDCGVVIRRQQEGESEESQQPLSSGVLIEVEGDDEKKGSLFLSIKKLRQICDVSDMGHDGNLYIELCALRGRDRKAGLYDCIAESLSSSAEQELCDLIIRIIRAQVSKSGEVLVYF